MKYTIYIAVLLGAFVCTSVARPTETSTAGTENTESPPSSQPPSSSLPEEEPPSNFSGEASPSNTSTEHEASPSTPTAQESAPSSPPGLGCRCHLGSIRRKKQCSESSESLDHSTVQGWGLGRADWSCLPDVVEENHGVCYRTTVYTCDDQPQDIQCALKQRSSEFNEIQRKPSGQTLFVKSPRFGKKDYRNREFCIYNINMSQCTSGRLRIKTVQDNMDLYTDDDNNCNDYLEFNFPDNRYRRFCGTESFEFQTRSASFYAVFWTDTNHRSSGFQFTASCIEDDSLDSSSGA